MWTRFRLGLFFLVVATSFSGLWIAMSSVTFQDEWKAPESAKGMKNPIAANETSLGEGKTLFEKYCVMCHGETGKGDGAMASMLMQTPADLRERYKAQTEGELFWKTSNGRDPMPGFATKLSQDDIWKAILYIGSLKGPE